MTLPAMALLLAAALTDPSLFSSQAAARYDGVFTAVRPFAAALGVLAPADTERYRAAFDAQRQGDFARADALAASTGDPILRGTLLGERYASARYNASYNELAQWLGRYGDYPQAAAVYRRALALSHAENALSPAGGPSHAALQGFSNGTDPSALHGEPYARHWNAGLDAFRKGRMGDALQHFEALLHGRDDLPDADYAAVAFWAYRTAKALGNLPLAAQYAQEAADQPPCFYSILARSLNGQRPSGIDAAASGMEEVVPLLRKAAVRRVVALKEIGQDMLAERELRALFPAAGEGERKLLVTLAKLLSLPAAQMRMALAAADSDEANDLYYPMPRWTPTAGYRIAPPLLFAIMRQESGFNPNARSASGALGVMQLMPATASAMARSARIPALSNAPSVSMALGQTYLEQLMGDGRIGDNLVFLTAAYNAGPGMLENWEHRLHYKHDPLLFIESIPYPQTRDYVVHVLGNYWVYSQLMGGYDTSAAAVSQGQWPRYAGTEKELTSMLDRLGSD